MNESCLKLRELINIPMNGVSLRHQNIAERIDDISLSCLSRYGQEMWDDILEAKVESLGGSTLVISGVPTDRFCEFRKLMLGECDSDLYEKCIVDAETYLADETIKPAVGFLPNVVELIATYEDLKNVSPQERLTAYFGDYGMHYMVDDFELETVRNMRDEALRFMGMTLDEFNSSDEFWTRQNIRLRMREGMMADKIQPGDEILFVNTEPLAGPNDFRKVGGRILSVDTDSKTCMVQTQMPKTSVPFRNILAKYNEQVHERHFGFDHCEPILGITESDAHRLLVETKELYRQEQQNRECLDMEMNM